MLQLDYKPLMAAYIRGHLVETGVPFLNKSLIQTPLEQRLVNSWRKLSGQAERLN